MIGSETDNSADSQSVGVILPAPPSFSERLSRSPLLFACIALAVVFFMYQVVGGTIIALVFHGKVRPENVQGVRFMTMLGQVVLILVPTLFLSRLQTDKLTATLRFHAVGGREILLAVVGVISLQQVLQVYLGAQDLIPIPPSLRPLIESLRKAIEETYRVLVAAHSIPELVYVLMVVALVPAFCEELLFRGLVQTNFEKGLSGTWGFIIPGVIFGAYHLNPFSFVPLAALGIYFGLLVYRSKSILVSIAAHLANNAFAVLGVFFTGEDVPFHDVVGTLTPSSIALNLGGFGGLFVLSTYAFIKLTRERQQALVVET
jgi:membrane protease YdiL (CAAX protease family)